MTFKKGQPSANPHGRPKGARNRRAVEVERQARAQGLTPLQVMIGTVEHLLNRANGAREPAKTEFKERAAEIAAKAAPYLHPRLSAVEHTGKDGGPIETRTLVVPDGVAARILAATGIDVRAAEQETRH